MGDFKAQFHEDGGRTRATFTRERTFTATLRKSEAQPHGTFEDAKPFKASVRDGNTEMRSTFGTVVQVSTGDHYRGEYEVIPSGETQTLPTMGKTLGANIRVRPIPSNYGLITWNGSTLTVS